jgi:tripartite-type tricarboxylate transporter receptor subunit TctC
MLGADAVAKAKGDGYTLLLAPNTTMTVVPLVYAKRPYQQRDLDVLGLVATNQFIVCSMVTSVAAAEAAPRSTAPARWRMSGVIQPGWNIASSALPCFY